MEILPYRNLFPATKVNKLFRKIPLPIKFNKTPSYIMTYFSNITNDKNIAYLFVIVAGAIISLYSVLSTDVINNDGILYIYTAEAFLRGGLAEAMTMFSWPFFSFLIALFHKITGLSLEAAAYSINAIFLIITSITFIRIYQEISTSYSTLWIPALLILTLPIMNEYRAYIIRGHGAWTFSLLALLYFIKYAKNHSHKNALYWQIFALCGTLFRIEGIVYITFAPLYFIFPKETRSKFFLHLLKVNSILLPLATAFIATLFIYILKMEQLSDDLELRLSYMLPSSMLNSIREAATGIEPLMPNVSSGEALIIVSSGLFALIAFKALKNINIFYLAVWAYSHKHKLTTLSRESHIVIYFALISLLPLIAIAGNQLFMSSRYTVLTIIFISLIISQYFESLWAKLASSGKPIKKSMLVIFVALFFLDAIIHTGATKGIMVTSSRWVKDNLSNSNTACNDTRFVYYTGKSCVYERNLDKGTISDVSKFINEDRYNYLLMWIDEKSTNLKELLDADKTLKLTKSYKNKDNDEVRVYLINKANHPQ